jgi:hypothetical protein
MLLAMAHRDARRVEINGRIPCVKAVRQPVEELDAPGRGLSCGGALRVDEEAVGATPLQRARLWRDQARSVGCVLDFRSEGFGRWVGRVEVEAVEPPRRPCYPIDFRSPGYREWVLTRAGRSRAETPET